MRLFGFLSIEHVIGFVGKLAAKLETFAQEIEAKAAAKRAQAMTPPQSGTAAKGSN